MDVELLIKAAILGVIEGLTEFLPISSTGHLIVGSSLLRFTGQHVATFEVAIQTGAIFAIIWEYRARLWSTAIGIMNERRAQRFAVNVLIAFTPAVILGLAFGGFIKLHLFHPLPVATMFVLGGIVIIGVEARHRRRFGALDLAGTRRARVETVDDMTALDALKVGIVQCAALIPGTSRSGATIIGGMLFGLSRKAATEFSFFLAIPTLIGAGVYSMWKQRDFIAAPDLPMFGVGLVFAFISALVCVRWLIRWVSTHDFTPFGWYRIAFGLLILGTAYFSWLDWAR